MNGYHQHNMFNAYTTFRIKVFMPANQKLSLFKYLEKLARSQTLSIRELFVTVVSKRKVETFSAEQDMSHSIISQTACALSSLRLHRALTISTI